VKEGSAVVTHAAEAAKVIRQFLGDVPEEHFVLMVLDCRRRVIGINEVSVGTLSASFDPYSYRQKGPYERFSYHLHC
jgi:DNA repair protein RadC